MRIWGQRYLNPFDKKERKISVSEGISVLLQRGTYFWSELELQFSIGFLNPF